MANVLHSVYFLCALIAISAIQSISAPESRAALATTLTRPGYEPVSHFSRQSRAHERGLELLQYVFGLEPAGLMPRRTSTPSSPPSHTTNEHRLRTAIGQNGRICKGHIEHCKAMKSQSQSPNLADQHFFMTVRSPHRIWRTHHIHLPKIQERQERTHRSQEHMERVGQTRPEEGRRRGAVRCHSGVFQFSFQSDFMTSMCDFRWAHCLEAVLFPMRGVFLFLCT